MPLVISIVIGSLLTVPCFALAIWSGRKLGDGHLLTLFFTATGALSIPLSIIAMNFFLYGVVKSLIGILFVLGLFKFVAHLDGPDSAFSGGW